MEEAYSARYSRLEQEARGHLIDAMAEAEAERQQRIQAQQHAQQLEEESDHLRANAMQDGLEDVIKLDRARQECGWTQAGLHTMGEEFALAARKHQVDLQSCEAATWERARVEFQANYASLADEFQRQCDQQIMESHEQVLAHERTIVELRTIVEANQRASNQESQAS